MLADQEKEALLNAINIIAEIHSHGVPSNSERQNIIRSLGIERKIVNGKKIVTGAKQGLIRAIENIAENNSLFDTTKKQYEDTCISLRLPSNWYELNK